MSDSVDWECRTFSVKKGYSCIKMASGRSSAYFFFSSFFIFRLAIIYAFGKVCIRNIRVLILAFLHFSNPLRFHSSFSIEFPFLK